VRLSSKAEEPREGFTALGRVIRAHGIHGELRVEAFAPGAPNLQKGRRVFVAGQEYRVAQARPERAAWLLKLRGLDDRTTAEKLQGLLVEAADADVARDDSDSYFIHELIGLRVVTVDGRELGTVTEVMQTGANDVYVATGPKGEVLIPAIGMVVEAIDLKAGTIRITPLPGMLDESK
jgi:16S rRNA processing protein RimM